MSEIFCHHKGRYNIYNTVSDGFRFVSSISLEQLERLIEEGKGKKGLTQLLTRLERAHQNGHSAASNETLEDFLSANRTGDNEEFLTTEECIMRFHS